MLNTNRKNSGNWYWERGAENLLSATWKRGKVFDLSAHTKRAGRKSRREREDWLRGCVSVWVRDTERRRRRSSLDSGNSRSPSDLACGEDTHLDVHSWGSQQQKDSRIEWRRSCDHVWLPPELCWIHMCLRYTRSQASVHAHKPSSRLFCPVRTEGFPQAVSKKEGENINREEVWHFKEQEKIHPLSRWV